MENEPGGMIEDRGRMGEEGGSRIEEGGIMIQDQKRGRRRGGRRRDDRVSKEEGEGRKRGSESRGGRGRENGGAKPSQTERGGQINATALLGGCPRSVIKFLSTAQQS